MGLLELHWWNVIAGAVKASVVVPVDPASGREFDVDDGAVGPLVEDGGADALGLVEAVDALHEGVIVGVTDRSDRGQDLLESEMIGQPNRRVCDPASL